VSWLPDVLAELFFKMPGLAGVRACAAHDEYSFGFIQGGPHRLVYHALYGCWIAVIFW